MPRGLSEAKGREETPASSPARGAPDGAGAPVPDLDSPISGTPGGGLRREAVYIGYLENLARHRPRLFLKDSGRDEPEACSGTSTTRAPPWGVAGAKSAPELRGLIGEEKSQVGVKVMFNVEADLTKLERNPRKALAAAVKTSKAEVKVKDLAPEER